MSAPPAESNPHTTATVTAASGGILGLLIVFLPALQLLPQHASTGEIKAAFVTGGGTFVVSVLGKLAHHFGITKAQMASGESVFEKYKPQLEAAEKSLEQTGVFRAELANVKSIATTAQAHAEALENKVPEPIRQLTEEDLDAVSDALLAKWARRAATGNAPVLPAAP